MLTHPTAPQILQAVIAWMEQSQRTSARENSYLSLVARNALGIVLRELEQSPQADEAATTRLERLLGHTGALPDLEAELFRRASVVDAKVLPGMGTKAKDVPGAVYFVIGPEKQLAAWEEYLKREDSAEARVWRLYPRDFWLTGE